MLTFGEVGQLPPRLLASELGNLGWDSQCRQVVSFYCGRPRQRGEKHFNPYALIFLFTSLKELRTNGLGFSQQNVASSSNPLSRRVVTSEWLGVSELELPESIGPKPKPEELII
jgi:hypothetical protein